MEYSGTLQPHETQEDDNRQSPQRIETFSDRIRDILRPKLEKTENSDETTTDKKESKPKNRKSKIGKFVSDLLFGLTPRQDREQYPDQPIVERQALRRHIPMGIELGGPKEGLSPGLKTENSSAEQTQNYSVKPAGSNQLEDKPANEFADNPDQLTEQTYESPVGHDESIVEPNLADENPNLGAMPDQEPIDAITSQKRGANSRPSLIGEGFVDQLLRRSDTNIKEASSNDLAGESSQQPEQPAPNTELNEKKLDRSDQTGYRIENLYNNHPEAKNSEAAPNLTRLGDENYPESTKSNQPSAENVKTTATSPADRLRPGLANDLDPTEFFKPDLKERSSQLVLERVEAAADQDIALENQYERRHEVKDVASVGQYSGASQSSSVSTSMQNNPVTPKTNTPTTKLNKPVPKQDPKKVNPAITTYKKAAKTGLTAGIILILVVILFLLLR